MKLTRIVSALDNLVVKLVVAVSILTAVSTVGCMGPSEVVETGNTQTIVNTPAAVKNDAICNPFDSQGQAGVDLDHGIVGTLTNLMDVPPRYRNIHNYKGHGEPINATLFLGALDVPTRPFDAGFLMPDGSPIKNNRGNTLYEYFSMNLESVIRLSNSNAAGKYQFALLSDDGSVLQIDDGNGFRTLIDNDGNHPTRLECATEPVTMDFMTKLPIRLDYYQGPAHHIALMLLWREWPAAGGDDPACGQVGNNKFFDSRVTPPAPQKVFQGMLARGWKVVPGENFHLPESVTSNPCVATGGGTGGCGNTTPEPVEPIATMITKVTPEELLTRLTAITFEFTSNKPGATFMCSLDAGVPETCTSPWSYSGLIDGEHFFVVRAQENGVEDAAGAGHSWQVDTLLPGVVQMSTSVTSTTMTITWRTNKPTTTTLYWGLGTSVANVVPEDNIYSFDHVVTVTGLNRATIYSFQMSGRDQIGDTFVSSRNAARTAP